MFLQQTYTAQHRNLATALKRGTAIAALLVCAATPNIAVANDTDATDSAATVDALSDQLIAETLARGTAAPETAATEKVSEDAMNVATPPSSSPYGPQVSLRPVARNSFTISLQKGALAGAPENDGGFMLRTAGYVIAHDVCGKFQMRVSSVAFRNTREGKAASVTGTVVCKQRKDRAVQS